MAGLAEVFRVLKPGGVFIGTVAFLEPFHGNSFYHHTHLAAHSSLVAAGFSVERVAPNAKWPGLVAQATMDALFPKMPSVVGKGLVWPLLVVHRIWWYFGALVSSRADDTARLVRNTGAFSLSHASPANESS